MNTGNKLKILRRVLAGMESAVVAFSGGVDSAFLAAVAQEVLGKSVLAVTVVTPFISREEQLWAKDVARQLNLKHSFKHLTFSREILQNPQNRCYLCKKHIFSCLCRLRDQKGYRYLIEGSHRDDLNEDRPGRKALKELRVRSPLEEAGLTKAEVRRLSKSMNLRGWARPSSPCLATRVPFGEAIEPGTLKYAAQAESFLRGLGLESVRVRVHGSVARVEADPRRLPILIKNRVGIIKRLKKRPVTYVCIDLEGYRSGSMNEVRRWKHL
ncbi:MAG TPA: ATP-dependent sacrificial sulfur transferase LarE [Candidatus Omnitrophota bacterium]|nr:ATP-dependent sacrificial sulfur transferase LarE [Candidatus Omnitrophota bacterium]HPN55386.1 ATP-dependent sacrificial sulfur transferase LarE [Candidatus Omnitrophota bacterium]